MKNWLMAGLLILAGCASSGSSDPEAYWESSDLEEAAQLNTQIGIELARAGDYARAQEKLEKAIAQNSDYAIAHQTLALVHMWRGKYEESESAFEEALSLDRDNPETLNNYGSLLCRQKRFDEAHEKFMSAVEDRSYKTPERAWLNAGICAVDADNRARAETSFRAVLKNNPRHANALLELARLNNHFGDYVKARAFMQRLEQVVSELPASALLLGAKIELALRNRIEAKRYAQKIRTDFPDSPEVLDLIELRL